MKVTSNLQFQRTRKRRGRLNKKNGTAGLSGQVSESTVDPLTSYKYYSTASRVSSTLQRGSDWLENALLFSTIKSIESTFQPNSGQNKVSRI